MMGSAAEGLEDLAGGALRAQSRLGESRRAGQAPPLRKARNYLRRDLRIWRGALRAEESSAR